MFSRSERNNEWILEKLTIWHFEIGMMYWEWLFLTEDGQFIIEGHHFETRWEL